jgi:ATP/maltotriose-dependent transcriptional regulator MalT
VEKHLEAIYARLGVQSRGQAIATTLQALQEGGPQPTPAGQG